MLVGRIIFQFDDEPFQTMKSDKFADDDDRLGVTNIQSLARNTNMTS